MAKRSDWLLTKSHLLLEFSSQLEESGVVDWDRFLAQCPNNITRTELLAGLIVCDLEHTCWPPGRLRQHVSLFLAKGGASTSVVSLLRDVFVSQVEAGAKPQFREFDGLGFSPEDLRLRLDNELFHLGLVIAGRWTLEQRLGHGRSGTVYRAFDYNTNERVALKEFSDPDLRRAGSQNTLVESELEALAGFHHPSVCRLLQGIVHPDGRVLAHIYECPSEITLANEIAKDRLTPQRSLYIAAQIADAIDYFHEKGSLHCDLKPENILLDIEGSPYVADFGFAISAAEQIELGQGIAGSQGYMSPEAVAGESQRIDGRSDIWSLGAILYEMLVGRSFWGDSRGVSNIAECIRSHLPENVPAGTLRVLENCLATPQNDRYDCACLLAEDVRRLLNVEDADAAPHRSISQLCLGAWRLGLRFVEALALAKLASDEQRVREIVEDIVRLARPVTLEPSSEDRLKHLSDVAVATWEEHLEAPDIASHLQGRLMLVKQALESYLLSQTDIASETFSLAIESSLDECDDETVARIWQLAESLDLEEECLPYVNALQKASTRAALQIERARMHKRIELYYRRMISQESRAARRRANRDQ
jgi:serine/threonine protein kinase